MNVRVRTLFRTTGLDLVTGRTRLDSQPRSKLNTMTVRMPDAFTVYLLILLQFAVLTNTYQHVLIMQTNNCLICLVKLLLSHVVAFRLFGENTSDHPPTPSLFRSKPTR